MLGTFREVVVVDTEFTAITGERPVPVCVVAHELGSGRRFRLFGGQFGPEPPYAAGADVLFVAFYASADLGVYRVLGWRMPERILDPFIEFRNRTNGLPTPAGSSLLGALAYFGLDAIAAVEKHEMQEAIGNGTWRGRFTPEEILDYAESDVEALTRLLFAMLPGIDLPRALFRGRYMTAAAAMEHHGTPIDVEMLGRLRQGWTGIQDDLIRAIDVHGIYDGRTFKSERWAKLIASLGIPWPMHESGQMDLSDDTFRQLAKSYPDVSPYRELRSSLADLRLNNLSVGRTHAIAQYCQRSGRALAAINRRTLGLYLGRRCGYVDWSNLHRAMPWLMWTGSSKSLALQPLCPAIWPCRPPISQAIHTSPLPSRRMPFPAMPRRQRTALNVSCLSSASSRCSMGCRQTGWRYVLRNRASSRATCC
jgi:hypothetical protein